MLVTLDSITTKITKGTTPTSVGCTFENNGINFIKSESLGNSRNLDRSKFAFISEQTHEKLKRSQIETNDILFSMAGMFLGKTAIVTSDLIPANTNQAVAIIRIDTDKANHEYVYYYLNQRSIIQTINASSAQSAQPNINLKQIGQLGINLPDRKTQDRIAAILSTIDIKIEVNNQINDNLQQQAQELYAEHFCLRDGDSIPDGWSLISLGDVAVISNKSFNPLKQPETMLEHYSIPAFDETRYPVFELSTAIKSNKFVVDVDCFMISKLNPTTKRVWRPYCMTNNAVCSTEFIVYKAKERELTEFLYSLIDSVPFSDFMCSHVTGSTGSRQRTIPTDTLQYQFYLPTAEEIAAFSAVVAPLYAQIRINAMENARLKALRDSLLPRLMSGEIEVSNIEI